MSKLTFIDLFCGCGGFSLGLERAGLQGLAAIDFNSEAITVYKKNLPHVPHILQEDLTKFRPSELQTLIGDKVDVIVGGPPCQGFSTARQRDGANHGERLVKEDTRRQLYQEFLRHIEFFRPKVFVMENVLGIRTASGGDYFVRVQKEARALGYRVHAQVEKAFDLGVPQKRIRQLFIGTRLDIPGYFSTELRSAPRASTHPTLGQAIGDLPALKAGEGMQSADYDLDCRERYLKNSSNWDYLFKTLEVSRAERLTSHVARPQSERDLRDFLLLEEGESSAKAMRRGVKFEFPYDKENFKDRYTRQHRGRPCSTIVAHMSKDGLMFIHPTQNRSLTAREAARVQSFPDWYEFPISRMHQFRVIGNAVPPLVSEAVGMAAKSYIEKATKTSRLAPAFLDRIPRDEKEAMRWILPLIDIDTGRLRSVSDDELKRAWFSVAFLYVGLHPDGALEHGDRIALEAHGFRAVGRLELRLIQPYYEQSGWPVALAPLAKEAWRRYKRGSFRIDEFYCSEAQMAGSCHRNPSLSYGVREEREKLVT